MSTPHEPMLYDDPALQLTEGAGQRLIAADQLARGYRLRHADGRIEHRTYTVIATFPDGSVLVRDP